MKGILTVLAALPLLAHAPHSGKPAEPEPLRAQIRSADTSRVLVVRVRISGNVNAVGTSNTDGGFVRMSGDSGVATTPVVIEIGSADADVTVESTASEPELVLTALPSSGARVPRFSARGHRVHLFRNRTDGRVGVDAGKAGSGPR